jgi:hypothetical protein
VLVSPGFSWSAGDETTVTGGVFLGLGNGAPTLERPIASEFGLVPATAYLSISVFF